MLTHFVHNDVARAEKYFLTGLDRADYSIEGLEFAGLWRGRGAATLGLDGKVQRDDFNSMCENVHPHLGHQLSPRNRDDRRIAYDLCEGGPKSLSIQWGFTGDAAIHNAFRESNAYMMSVLEQEFASGRVRIDGANEDRATGNLAWAEFMHLTARPVRGVPDPQIHIHNFVFNYTHDETEDRWKAAQMNRVIKACPFLDALFLSDLARRMEQHGYAIEKRGKSWELAGYSRALIEQFSNRTDKIEDTAERKGIIAKWLKAKIGAATREKKDKHLSIDELRKAWDRRLSDDERATIFDRKPTTSQPRRDEVLSAAVRHSLKTCFERSAVVRETSLLTEALLYTPGKCQLPEIRDEMKRQGVVIRDFAGIPFATTVDLAKEEKRMLEMVKAGRGKFSPIHSNPPKEPRLNVHRLNEVERQAANHILQSRDLVTIVRGNAETDFTKIMAAVGRESRQKLWRGVTRVAPSAATAREARGRFGRKRGQTVDAMLKKLKLRFRARRTFIWVEDGGRIGTQEMVKLGEMAKRWRARIVMTSTSRTEHGPTRGDPLHIIAKHSHTSTLELNQGTRSKARHRGVLDQLYAGNVPGAMASLEEMGRIKGTSAFKARETMIGEMTKAAKPGRTAVVVTNDESIRRQLNNDIRSALLKQKKSAHKGWKFATLIPRNLTEAERHDGKSYRRGDVVQFHRAALGFKNGGQWKVVGRNMLGHVMVRQGLTFEALPLRHAKRFQVFEPSQIKIRPGDMIRITKNAWVKGHGRRGKTSPLDWVKGTFSREVHAGDFHCVKGMTLKGDLKTESGLTFPRSFKHFEYGYAVPAHTAHRPRVDALIYGALKPSLNGIDAENIAGWMSKAKRSVTIVTDEKDVLLTSKGVHPDHKVALDVTEPKRRRAREAHWDKPRDQESTRERRRERGMEM